MSFYFSNDGSGWLPFCSCEKDIPMGIPIIVGNRCYNFIDGELKDLDTTSPTGNFFIFRAVRPRPLGLGI